MIRNLYNKTRKSNLSVVIEWNREEEKEKEEGEMCFIEEVIMESDHYNIRIHNIFYSYKQYDN